MRPIHLILGASLAANVLTVAGYLYTRRQLEGLDAAVSGATIIDELTLTPKQADRLRDMRRTLRSDLQAVRVEGQRLFDAALVKVREAKPGDTSYEPALLATGEVRRGQTLIITRELIAFREQLTPAQREIFNRHIGEWAFIEALMGLPSDGAKSPPTGLFRGTPAEPPKNGR